MVKGTLSHPSPTPPSLPLCLLFAILPGAGCEVPNDLSPKINPISRLAPSCGCLGSLGSLEVGVGGGGRLLAVVGVGDRSPSCWEGSSVWEA